MLEVGKSFIQVLDALVFGLKYPKSKQIIFRKTYPELERSIIRQMLEMWPKDAYSYNSSKHTAFLKNGSVIDFGYAETDNDIYKYQGAEWHCVRLDEGTHFSAYQYEYLRSRIRSTDNIPRNIMVTSNPGNEGHQFFKERFVDCCIPMEPYESVNPRTGKTTSRLFIPARVTDNPFLMQADPDYVNRLEDLPEEERRKLLLGDWNVFEGQFFPEFNRDIHVIDSYPKIDKNWRIYFTMDYGLDMAAGYFAAVDSRGVIYVLGEIHEPNVIISEFAKMIKSKQKELGLKNVDEYLGPSDMWNRRQETGLSVADIFYQNGIRLHKASRDRIDGWSALKEYMKPYKDEQDITVAKLRIYKTCVNLIRSIPALRYDEHRFGDASTEPHSATHSCDALRYLCITRVRANRDPVPKSESDKRIERTYNRFNSTSMYDDIYKGENSGYDTDNTGYNPMYL